MLSRYVHDPGSLRRAIETWRNARQHFEVTLAPDQVRKQLGAKLAWLPEQERRYWETLAGGMKTDDSLRFLAISLDSAGVPIPVVNTDPATGLFLADSLRKGQAGALKPAVVLQDIVPFVLPYPVGLLVTDLGPLVANDVYASRAVWERFRKDHYHGPRVVWGREVNLFFIGLANQISGAFDAAGRLEDPSSEPYVRTLYEALRLTLAAVHASALEHNELWSYRIEEGRLRPVRYGTSSDIQLWNTTNLAVQFALSRLPTLSR